MSETHEWVTVGQDFDCDHYLSTGSLTKTDVHTSRLSGHLPSSVHTPTFPTFLGPMVFTGRLQDSLKF